MLFGGGGVLRLPLPCRHRPPRSASPCCRSFPNLAPTCGQAHWLCLEQIATIRLPDFRRLAGNILDADAGSCSGHGAAMARVPATAPVRIALRHLRQAAGTPSLAAGPGPRDLTCRREPHTISRAVPRSRHGPAEQQSLAARLAAAPGPDLFRPHPGACRQFLAEAQGINTKYSALACSAVPFVVPRHAANILATPAFAPARRFAPAPTGPFWLLPV